MRAHVALRRIFVPMFLTACLTGWASPKAEIRSETQRSDRHLQLIVDSKAIAKNRIGDASYSMVEVLLPPSYAQSPKSYPVIYYLPGHGEGAGAVSGALRFAFDPAISSHEGREVIVVGVTGANKLGGSFYVNSPATGNWEDYVVKEVVPLIEKRFRAIPRAESRGLMGFSMGGFGALNLGMRHPDVFQAVFAVGPGVFDQDGLKNAMVTWGRGGFVTSYGAAFSPDLKAESPFARIPVFDGSEADNAIVSDWENGFGNWEGKITAYLAGKQRLAALHIEYGSRDSYAWIPQGCRYLAVLLDKHTVPYTIHEFRGGHALDSGTLADRAVPFFYDNLVF